MLGSASDVIPENTSWISLLAAALVHAFGERADMRADHLAQRASSCAVVRGVFRGLVFIGNPGDRRLLLWRKCSRSS